MKRRTAHATWKGDLPSGNGYVAFNDKHIRLPYSFNSRFEEGEGTNPEELIGSALAGCYAMALSHALTEQGADVTAIETRAEVQLEKIDDGFKIPGISLFTTGDVRDIDPDTFQEIARAVGRDCPVAKALTGVDIDVNASLKN